MNEIKLLGFRVLLEKTEKKTFTKFFQKEEYSEAKVVSTGIDVVDLNPGDFVFFEEKNAKKVRISDKEYFLTTQDDVVAVLE